MKDIEADGFRFTFPDAIDAFVFDEKDKQKPTFHGVPMKGVDIIVELESSYIFIEMKDYDDYSVKNVKVATTEEERSEKQDHFKWLKQYLKEKYRDTYLYRYAEQKVEKPVHYICLITYDNALNNILQKALQFELPVGKASVRWSIEIAKSCKVVNIDRWNQNFPKWKLERLNVQ